MPLLLSEGNCQYTAISTNGTTTLNPGQAGAPGVGYQNSLPSSFGVFWGAYLSALGTAPVLNVYDIIPPSGVGTNTATVTNLLMNGTGTAIGQSFAPGPLGVGIRYRGALVAVTSGTAAGTWNALWD